MDTSSPLLECLDEIESTLKEVAWVNPLFMPVEDKATALTRLGEISSELAGLRLRVLASAGDLAEREGAKDLGVWLRNHTREDLPAARAEVKLAEAIDRDCPRLAAALTEGTVSLDQARVIAKVLSELPEQMPPEGCLLAEDRVKAEQLLIHHAQQHTPKELRRLGQGILEAVDPDRFEAAEARALAKAEREAEKRVSLTFRNNGDGTMSFTGKLPLSDAARFKTYLDAYAQPRKSTLEEQGKKVPYDRLLGQAFQQLLARYETDRLPHHGGDATTMMVTIDLEDLHKELGTAELGFEGEHITAAQARRMACNAEIIPVVLGTDSQIVDVGRGFRLFVPIQRKLVRMRDKTCRAEGCDVPAAWCDVHHLLPWAHGGKTDLANAALLCGHHHRKAHQPDLTLTRLPNGDLRYHPRT